MTHELEKLLNQVRLSYQNAVRIGDRIHADENVSMGMRAVLEFLFRSGPATVPDIARSRHVTRQAVQILANDLLQNRLIRQEDNPAHKRSSLLVLTNRGRELIERMRARESRLYCQAGESLDAGEIRSAAALLARTTSALKDAAERE